MNIKTLDCRGLACPRPVVETKKCLDEMRDGTLTILVDNDTAKNNLLKLAGSLKLDAAVLEEGGIFTVTVNKDDTGPAPVKEELPGLLLTAETMGRGSEELGQLLMRSFFYALAESETLPESVYLVNGAVKLACAGSPVLESLEKLSSRGVQLNSCGLCLDYFELKEKLSIGEITNMYAIVDRVMKGQVVII